MALPPVLRLPPVPRRSRVLEHGLISREWDQWLNDVVRQIDLVTPIGTFANNAAAVAANIPVGQVYQTATGEIRVVV